MDRRHIIIGAIAFAFTSIPYGVLARGRRISLGRGISRGSANSYTGDTLTQAELENCLLSELEVEVSEQALGQLEDELLPLENHLMELGRQIDVKAQTLNRYSEADVNQYNAMVEMYENTRSEFNRRVETYNSNSTSFNADVEKFNLVCGDKQYYEDDMISARLATGIQ